MVKERERLVSERYVTIVGVSDCMSDGWMRLCVSRSRWCQVMDALTLVTQTVARSDGCYQLRRMISGLLEHVWRGLVCTGCDCAAFYQQSHKGKSTRARTHIHTHLHLFPCVRNRQGDCPPHSHPPITQLQAKRKAGQPDENLERKITEMDRLQKLVRDLEVFTDGWVQKTCECWSALKESNLCLCRLLSNISAWSS